MKEMLSMDIQAMALHSEKVELISAYPPIATLTTGAWSLLDPQPKTFSEAMPPSHGRRMIHTHQHQEVFSFL